MIAEDSGQAEPALRLLADKGRALLPHFVSAGYCWSHAPDRDGHRSVAGDAGGEVGFGARRVGHAQLGADLG